MTYIPGSPPSELTLQFVVDEFNKLRDFVETMQIDYISYKIHNSAPNKPREAQAYYADGTNWNPGSGKGLYLYDGTTFNKL